MTLKNIKQQGFTIVELLIVIVVIAILAAITIVAYNGVQNRAKATSGQQLSSSIGKKAQLYNTLASQYPTYAQLSGNTAPSGYTGSLTEAKLDNSSAVQNADVDASTADGGKVVTYKVCGTTGAKIGWWDYSKSSSQLTWSYIGDATSSSTCS